MKNKFTMIALLFLIGAAGKVQAQVDPHFSQYYAYPLWLNPALTGVMNGELRASANYKNQWASVGKGYQTEAASVDFRPGSSVGLGLTVLDQSAGDAGFNYFSAHGSFGYAVAVSRDGNQKLSFGLQAGIINRSFDISKLQFGSQYNSELGFDSGMSSMENFSSRNTSVVDVNAGIFYYNGDPLSNINWFGGASVSHLSRPKDAFATTTDGKIPLRYVVHGGVRLRVSESLDLTPNALFINQQDAQIKAIGAYSEFKGPNGGGLIVGGMYRFQDAAIGDVGYHFGNTIIGFSYDFNTSGLNRATAGQGGMELSISYVFHKRISEPEPICPRL